MSVVNGNGGAAPAQQESHPYVMEIGPAAAVTALGVATLAGGSYTTGQGNPYLGVPMMVAGSVAALKGGFDFTVRVIEGAALAAIVGGTLMLFGWMLDNH